MPRTRQTTQSATSQSSTTSSAPQPQQVNAPASFNTTQDIIFRAEFEKSVKWMDDRIANTNYMMSVILAVLAVGFVTLLLAVFGIIIQFFQFNGTAEGDLSNSLKEETKQIDNLTSNMKTLNNKLSKFTPTPTK